MRAKIYVTLKNGVLDPQGKAAQGALEHLGFNGVKDVRIGKFIEVELSEMDKTIASRHVEDMCRKLLVNGVVENFKFELEGK